MALYANDWHACFRCGCTFQQKTLKTFHHIDTVLNIDQHVWVCADRERCRLFMRHRRAELKREQDAVLRQISKRPIRARRAASR